MTERIKKIIEELNLERHPEGGFFKETYRSPLRIAAKELGHPFTGDRNVSTCIYFLLTNDQFSAFHRIRQDEIWHFYEGDSIMIHMISSNGKYSIVTIGNDWSSGHLPQFVVPAGTWFASEVIKDGSYSLAGCTVSPGFDFNDFELAKRQELTDEFPQHSLVINRLTRQ